MAQDPTVEVAISAKDAGLKDGMDKAVSAVSSGVGQMQNAFEGLGGAFEKALGPLTIFLGVLAGGAAMKEFVSEAVAGALEVGKLATKLGTTAEEADRLATAIKLAGGETSDYVAMTSRLDMQLRKNEDGLNKMGIATRGANGELLDQKTITDNAVASMMRYKEGTDRNLAAMAMFGRGADAAMLLVKAKAKEEEAARVQQALNISTTQEEIAMAKSYRDSMNEVKFALEATGEEIGKTLLPVLTELGMWFRGDGMAALGMFIQSIQILGNTFTILGEIIADVWGTIKSLFESLDGVVNESVGSTIRWFEVWKTSLKGIIVILETLHLVFKVVLEGISIMLEGTIAWVKRFADVAKAALSMDWDGVKAAWDEGGRKIEAVTKKHLENIVNAASDTKKRLGDLMGVELVEAREPKKKASGESWKGDKDKDGKEESMMAKWKAMLTEKLEADKNYFKDSVKEELAFWEAKKALTKKGSKDEAAVAHEIYALHKKIATDDRALAIEKAASDARIRKLELDNKKEELRHRKEMGDLTLEDETASLKAFVEEEYQIELLALQEKIKLYGQDEKEYAKLQDQKLMLDQKRIASLKKVENKLVEEQKKRMQATLAPIANAFEKSITGMIQGTITFKKAMQNMGQSILGEFVNNFVKKMVTEWLTGEMTKLASSSSFFAEWLGIKTATEETSAVTTKATNMSEAMSGAALGAVNAMSSVAAIPFVGWAMAPGVGAAQLALGESMAAMAGFAVGSWDVPDDMFTKIHKGEMIVPAQFAENVRDGGGLGGKSGGDVHYHDNSGKLSRQTIRENAKVIAEELNKTHRNGWRPAN